jgi:hypothetical protein
MVETVLLPIRVSLEYSYGVDVFPEHDTSRLGQVYILLFYLRNNSRAAFISALLTL